jgi:hypothetical protein
VPVPPLPLVPVPPVPLVPVPPVLEVTACAPNRSNAKFVGKELASTQAFNDRVNRPIAPPEPELFCRNSTSDPLLATTALNFSPVFRDSVALQSLFTL